MDGMGNGNGKAKITHKVHVVHYECFMGILRTKMLYEYAECVNVGTHILEIREKNSAETRDRTRDL